MMLNTHGSFVTDQLCNGERQTFMCHFLFMHNFIMLLNVCIIIMRNRLVFHKKVNFQVTCLWIYRLIHRINSFMVLE